MRVAITHTDFRVYWPARLRALEAFLGERDIELVIIEIAGEGSPYAAIDSGNAADSANYRCLFPATRMEDIVAADAVDALQGELDKIDPDVVLAGALAYPSGAGALAWALEHDRRCIIFDNARLADVPRSALVNWVKRQLYSRVDAVLVPAPSHSDAFAFWGVEGARIFFGLNVVANAWFRERTDYSADERAALRQKHGLPADFLLGVGRQVEKKNWVSLLDAWHAAGTGDTSHLVLVGNGPERSAIEQRIADSKLSNVILRPFQDPETLCEYYAAAGGLVLPSRYGETWGLVVNEAMVAGLPVLVSRQCGCAETLVTKANGWQFDADSDEEMSEAIQAFWQMPAAQRALMGQKSQEQIAEWGLDRFCNGAYDAIEYAQATPNPRAKVLGKCLLTFWKGRYRPT